VKALAAFALTVGALVAASSAPEPASGASPQTWQSRVGAAVRYAETRAGTVSFAVVDEAGRLHGYHARAVAPSASVLKAMLLVAYLRRADVRDRPLQQWERDLLAPMIRRSDNNAATRMVGLVGEARLNALARAAGMEHFRLHWPIWGESEITPRGQAYFFDRIDALLPQRHRVYARHLLATVVPSQRWGVGRVPHPGWRLYFKGGWGSGTGLVDHQVAQYAAGGERFSLALFTRFNPNHDYGKETLRGLGVRLLAGVPRPSPRRAAVRRATVDDGYLVTVGRGCSTLKIEPLGGSIHRYATRAPSCGGFRLASAGPSALWSWRDGGASRLAAARYGSPAVANLGTFGGSDPLGRLAGGGRVVAYLHGGSVTRVGGSDCAVPGARLAAGAGRVAVAAHGTIRVVDPGTCAVLRTLSAAGAVRALAVGEDVLGSLSEGRGGHLRLERFRISTGLRFGSTVVPRSTLSTLSLGHSWLLYRTPHLLRALAVGSGRSWTLWRTRLRVVGAGTSGGSALWLENHNGGARVWSLRLPAG
jgi:hypothetical protein